MADELLNGDRYLRPGTKVRLDSLVNGNDEVTSEYGIIVHCWEEKEFAFYDCCVAFSATRYRRKKPAEKPYVLRYAANSLTTIL